MGKDKPIAEIVKSLSLILGEKITSHIGRLDNPRWIQGWINGTLVPDQFTECRFRTAYEIILGLEEEAIPRIAIKKFFSSPNASLDNLIPVDALAQAKTEQELLSIYYLGIAVI